MYTNIHFISLCVQNIVYIYVYNIVFTLTDKMNINTIDFSNISVRKATGRHLRTKYVHSRRKKNNIVQKFRV